MEDIVDKGRGHTSSLLGFEKDLTDIKERILKSKQASSNVSVRDKLLN